MVVHHGTGMAFDALLLHLVCILLCSNEMLLLLNINYDIT